MWICWSKKVLWVHVCIFVVKSKGSLELGTLNPGSTWGGRNASAKGLQAHGLRSRSMVFFLVVSKCRSCSWPAGAGHVPRSCICLTQEFRSQTRRLVVPGRKQCRIFPPHLKSHEIIVYLCWCSS